MLAVIHDAWYLCTAKLLRTCLAFLCALCLHRLQRQLRGFARCDHLLYLSLELITGRDGHGVDLYCSPSFSPDQHAPCQDLERDYLLHDWEEARGQMDHYQRLQMWLISRGKQDICSMSAASSEQLMCCEERVVDNRVIVVRGLVIVILHLGVTTSA